MPARLRPPFGLSYSLWERVIGVHWLVLFGLFYCALPPRLRWYTQYHERQLRLSQPPNAAATNPQLPLIARLGRVLANFYVNSYLWVMSNGPPKADIPEHGAMEM